MSISYDKNSNTLENDTEDKKIKKNQAIVYDFSNIDAIKNSMFDSKIKKILQKVLQATNTKSLVILKIKQSQKENIYLQLDDIYYDKVACVSYIKSEQDTSKIYTNINYLTVKSDIDNIITFQKIQKTGFYVLSFE